MIETVLKEDHVLIRISTSNGSINSGIEFVCDAGKPAWHEIRINLDQINEFLKEDNWDLDVDYGEKMWECGNILILRPLEEFEDGWDLSTRLVLKYNDLKWHIAEWEIDTIKTEFEKFHNR